MNCVVNPFPTVCLIGYHAAEVCPVWVVMVRLDLVATGIPEADPTGVRVVKSEMTKASVMEGLVHASGPKIVTAAGLRRGDGTGTGCHQVDGVSINNRATSGSMNVTGSPELAVAVTWKSGVVRG